MGSLAAILDRAEGLLHDVGLATVRAWKEAHDGAPAVGYLPIYVPREILDAAGVLPVGLMGGGDRVEIIRGDAYFQSYICQLPRSTIELALSGRLDALDGFLFPSICDVIRNLSGMWKLLFKDRYVRYLDLPQDFDPLVGGRFWEEELRGLLADMEKLSGRKAGDDDLRASIARYNDNRRAVQELMALRRERPWLAPAWESYLVVRAGHMLPVEEHTAFLRDYLNTARALDRPVRDDARVVTVGSFCEQPPLDLIKTLELAGCAIVHDDLLLGPRWLTRDVPVEGDPIRNLGAAYLNDSVRTAARYEPGREKGDDLIRLVKDTGADGVVFAAPSFCDPALLDQPMLQDALDGAGIPWTAFKYAENLGQFQVIREQAGTFADSIKLWSDA